MSNQIEEITEKIRGDIKEGRLGAFNILPSRRALAQEFKTTVDTIAKVLRNLEIEGLITKGTGNSIRINSPRTRVTTNEETFRDVMTQQGYEVTVEHIKTPEVIETSAEIARAFNVPEGTKVVERMRREIVNGVVYRYSRKLYLAELISAEHLAAMQKDHTYNIREVIEQQRPLRRLEERIIARVVSTREEAEMLGTIKGAPVLEQWTINYDQEMKIVFISIVVFHGNMFEKKYDFAPGDGPKNTV